MTDISVSSYNVLTEDLSWDYTPDHDMTYKKGDTLDVSLFDPATHYPNGFIKSGCVLGRKTAGGALGPYLDTAADGRQTAVGHLAASIQVIRPTGTVRGKIGCAVIRAFAVIASAKLPYTSGATPLGGFLDAAAQADLPFIHYDATA